jgi:mannose-1-phosphate guanylyltransferase
MSSAHHYALILAGGRGTRFWPRSRRARAKQVLRFVGDQSLIQDTVERLRPLIPDERIWILTNEHLRGEIVRQLPDVPEEQILAEPAQRNTAPAIGLAAHILRSIDPNAVMGVFPADHYIARPADYRELLVPAFEAAENGKLAVLGIAPRWPETGYGYIEFPKGTRPGTLEPVPVLRFREKPDIETARKFVAAGNFYWNAGMFFWRCDVFLDALRTHLPATASVIDGLPPFQSNAFISALAGRYPETENISVDFAVLEKASNVVGLAAGEIAWNDVGSWNAVYELLDRDSKGNVSLGPTLLKDANGNYVESDGRLIAMLGVRDLIVVDTTDALLIADRARAQEVGDLVKMLEGEREDLL